MSWTCTMLFFNLYEYLVTVHAHHIDVQRLLYPHSLYYFLNRFCLLGRIPNPLAPLSLPATPYRAFLTKFREKFFKKFSLILNTEKFQKCQV